MKRKLSLACLLLITFSFGGYFGRHVLKDAWAAIQSQVGLNVWSVGLGSWRPMCDLLSSGSPTLVDGIIVSTATTTNGCVEADMQVIPYTWNGTSFDVARSGFNADAQTPTGFQNMLPYGFNGATWDRIRAGISSDANAGTGFLNGLPYIFNGATWDRQKSASGDTLAATGILASNISLFNGATFDRMRDVVSADNGLIGIVGVAPMVRADNGFRRISGTSAGAFTATTTNTVPLVAQLSTWSVTSTPAAATQATASKAAGGGTVRHVATTISACLTDTDSAEPGTVHLRDGATGAGTILRSWYLHIPAANNSRCVDLSGLAMIGTANTAMTIEFTAAGTANSLQTVTLTGFSVP